MVHISPCWTRRPDTYPSQWFSLLSPQVLHSAYIYHLPLWKGGHPNPALPFLKWLPSLPCMPSGPIEGCRWKGGPRGGKDIGILNRSSGNMGPPGIICGGMCGMCGGERNGGRWGFGMPGGGIPSLGPCMTPVPGRAIPGAVGDPSWLSVPISEGVPVSPLESLVESSGGFTLPAAKRIRDVVFFCIVAAQKKKTGGKHLKKLHHAMNGDNTAA